MQLKHKLEIVIDALYERVVPGNVREAFPELRELASTRFYRVFGCVLDRGLTENEESMLSSAIVDDDTVIDYYCDQVLSEWL